MLISIGIRLQNIRMPVTENRRNESIVSGCRPRAPDGDILERSLREVEAESVALLCCEALGLEGAKFCRGYIQNWLAGEVIPENSTQRIMGAAATILKAGVQAAMRSEDLTMDGSL
jgi:hypothetical protein